MKSYKIVSECKFWQSPLQTKCRQKLGLFPRPAVLSVGLTRFNTSMKKKQTSRFQVFTMVKVRKIEFLGFVAKFSAETPLKENREESAKIP